MKIHTKLAFLISLNTTALYSQISIDAGNNRSFCKNSISTTSSIASSKDTLGGKPTFSSPNSPYTYKWELKDSLLSSQKRRASYYLNDTTLSNPVFIKKDFLLDSIMVFLTVRDNIGISKRDSFYINIRGKFVATTDDVEYSKKSNETITGCSNVYPASKNGPLRHNWKPSINISDTINNCIKTWVTTNTTYYSTPTDKYGCKSEISAIFKVYIDDRLALNEFLVDEKSMLSQNSPNPFSTKSIIKYNVPTASKESFIGIYDLNGSQVKTITITTKGESAVTIKANELAPGMYVYSLVSDGNIVDTKRMVIVD